MQMFPLHILRLQICDQSSDVVKGAIHCSFMWMNDEQDDPLCDSSDIVHNYNWGAGNGLFLFGSE